MVNSNPFPLKIVSFSICRMLPGLSYQSPDWRIFRLLVRPGTAAFFRAIFVPSLSSSISDGGKRHAFGDSLEQKLKRRLSERPTPLHSFVQVMVLAKLKID